MAGFLPSVNGPRQQGKIVIADDEVLWRLMIADFLRKEGFQVIEVADANEAISALRANPDTGTVVCDLRMREADEGLTVARYARAHLPDARLVLASAHERPLHDRLFDACFVKPYPLQRLADWIKRRSRAPQP